MNRRIQVFDYKIFNSLLDQAELCSYLHYGVFYDDVKEDFSLQNHSFVKFNPKKLEDYSKKSKFISIKTFCSLYEVENKNMIISFFKMKQKELMGNESSGNIIKSGKSYEYIYTIWKKFIELWRKMKTFF